MIERIVSVRAQGNETLERAIRTKLILKGINPATYTEQSDDDPAVIRKLEKMLRDLHHRIGRFS
jgi:hypothetical protein